MTAVKNNLSSLVKSSLFSDTESYGVENLVSRSLNLEKEHIFVLLYQSDYLTIKAVKNRTFILGYPNLEVKKAFSRMLLQDVMEIQVQKLSIAAALENGDVDEAMKIINSTLATSSFIYWTTTHNELNPSGRGREFLAHLSLHLMLDILQSGEVTSEAHTSTGIGDIILSYPKFIYVIEVRIEKNEGGSREREALEQMKKRGDGQAFKNRNKRVVGVGISFDYSTRCYTYVAEEI